nr:cysteine-rich KTR domain-containing protein [uncultured Acetatifactor sp.]
MVSVISEWVRCPICGNKTRLQIQADTELKNFPLYCPKCRQKTLIPPFIRHYPTRTSCKARAIP